MVHSERKGWSYDACGDYIFAPHEIDAQLPCRSAQQGNVRSALDINNTK